MPLTSTIMPESDLWVSVPCRLAIIVSNVFRLPGVRVADGNCKGVRGVLRRKGRHPENRLDHPLNLYLFRPAVTDNRFFYLQGRVLIHGQVILGSGQEDNAPCVSLLYQALHVLPVENIFHGNDIGLRFSDQGRQVFVGLQQPLRHPLVPGKPDLAVQYLR